MPFFNMVEILPAAHFWAAKPCKETASEAVRPRRPASGARAERHRSVTAHGAQALPDRRLGPLDMAVLVGDDLQPAAHQPRSARLARAGNRDWSAARRPRCRGRRCRTAAPRPHRASRGSTGTADATGNWSRSPRRTDDRAAARARPPGPPRPARARGCPRRSSSPLRSRSTAVTGWPRAWNHRAWRPPPQARSRIAAPGLTKGAKRVIQREGSKSVCIAARLALLHAHSRAPGRLVQEEAARRPSARPWLRIS